MTTLTLTDKGDGLRAASLVAFQLLEPRGLERRASMFKPRIYPAKALESLKDYLERAKRLGNPRVAFIESWSERGYHSVTR